MRTLRVGLAVVLFLLGGSGVMAQSEHVMLGPDDVTWGAGPPSLPRGAMLAVIEGKPSEPGPFTMRLKFPAGFKVAPHSHPAIEHLTVLSGVIHFGMGDTFDAGKLMPMRAGSFIVMPVGTSHFVEAKEEAVVQVHGIGPWGVKYVNPADDPSKK
ncbi:MAG TPA: cupin domain-containing protein [Burkholderiales bacterium]